MLHHFKDEAEIGTNYLVRSTNFEYSYEENPQDSTNPIFSKLVSVTQMGHQAGFEPRLMPPVEFAYTEPTVDETIHEVDIRSLENPPYGSTELTTNGLTWMVKGHPEFSPSKRAPGSRPSGRIPVEQEAITNTTIDLSRSYRSFSRN
jgi:hypothetical protein